MDSDANNGSWRIGDWADTLELPNIGLQAIVRWVPGPQEITGTLPTSLSTLVVVDLNDDLRAHAQLQQYTP